MWSVKWFEHSVAHTFSILLHTTQQNIWLIDMRETFQTQCVIHWLCIISCKKFDNNWYCVCVTVKTVFPKVEEWVLCCVRIIWHFTVFMRVVHCWGWSSGRRGSPKSARCLFVKLTGGGDDKYR
jgi:hypothetical protein